MTSRWVSLRRAGKSRSSSATRSPDGRQFSDDGTSASHHPPRGGPPLTARTAEHTGDGKGAGLLYGLRLNVLAFGLSALWAPLNVLILPDLTRSTLPEGLRGSGIGLITFIGIGIAALVQPVAGNISDRAPFTDRRRPFILYPVVLSTVLLVALGFMPSFVLLLLTYVVLQLAMNVAQASFQALIPDVVEAGERSAASSAKIALGMAGTAAGLVGVGAVLLVAGNVAACVFLALILGAVLVMHLRWVPRIPPDEQRRARNVRELINVRTITTPFEHVPRMPPAFRRAVIMRFLVLLGLYPLQRFLFYFLEDRFQIEEPAGGAAAAMLGGILLAGLGAASASTLSRWLGRAVVLRASIIGSSVALGALAFAETLTVVMLIGVVFAVAVGAFQAANWAALSDSVPEDESAAFMGLANVATAGASALAGLLGPFVDLANAFVPGGTYHVVFTLAAFVTLLALPGVRAESAHEPTRRASPATGG